MENKKNEAPFEIYLDNLAAYTAGKAKGEWISLPQQEDALREIVSRIAAPEDEMMISDVSVREGCEYVRDVIGEWSNVYDLNMIAKLIGDDPHPAVQAYVEAGDTLSVEEFANLLMQEESIPFYPYEFEGSNNPEIMDKLSEEQKMGYTVIESNPEIKAMLESTQLGTSNVMGYIDVEAVGRDLSYSDYVFLNENGYYDKRAEGPDLEHYTMDEIREQLAEKEASLEQKQSQVQSKRRQHTPDISPSM